MSIVAGFKSACKWIYVIVAAAVATGLGILVYGGKKVAQGDAAATLRADRERLREAEESGDDSRVLDEWRRSRRKP